MPDINVRDEIRRAESRIRAATQDALTELYNRTSLTARSIEVNIIDTRTHSNPDGGLVGSVRITVGI